MNPQTSPPDTAATEDTPKRADPAAFRVTVVAIVALVLVIVAWVFKPSDFDRDCVALQVILNRERSGPLNAVDVSAARVIASRYADKMSPELAPLTTRACIIAQSAANSRIDSLPEADRLLIRDVIGGGLHNIYGETGVAPLSIHAIFDLYDVDLPNALRIAGERKAQWRDALHKQHGYSLEGNGSAIELVHRYVSTMGENQIPRRDVVVSLPISDAEIVSKALSTGGG